MAIPPSPGKYSIEEVQIQVDKITADLQVVSSKLAAMRDYPDAAKPQPKAEGKDDNHKAEAKGTTYGTRK
jgi:hypothetical protein